MGQLLTDEPPVHPVDHLLLLDQFLETSDLLIRLTGAWAERLILYSIGFWLQILTSSMVRSWRA